MNIEALQQMILQCGADKAATLTRHDIVLDERFRAICEQNQCGMYDRCWVCPPAAGDIHMLMERVREYDVGILYQTISQIEDSFDIEGMQAAAHHHALLAQRIERSLDRQKIDYFHLGCGGCRLCERCAKLDDQPCRFPGAPLLPLEVCGVDVYNTSRHTPLKYINGQNTVTYFGMLLYRVL